MNKKLFDDYVKIQYPEMGFTTSIIIFKMYIMIYFLIILLLINMELVDIPSSAVVSYMEISTNIMVVLTLSYVFVFIMPFTHNIIVWLRKKKGGSQ